MRYEDMEYENYKNVINCLDEFSCLSRADIAKKLSLSRTTVSNIVSALIAAGVVKESSVQLQDSASRGRPGSPIMFDDKWYALGASFYLSSWDFVLCDLEGVVVREYQLSVEHVTPDTLISTLISGIKFFLKDFKRSLLPAIGLGLPGVIDSDKGQILWAYDLKWNDFIDIRTPVEKAFGMAVYCLNRYSLAGLAEYTYANAEKDRDMVYVGIGSGIRSAIFINGRLLKGNNFSAGRIGHIPLDPRGPLCECGKHGCLLTLANESALVSYALKLASEESYSNSVLASMPKDDISPDLILSLADDGDECAERCVEHIAEPLIVAISILVDLINPRKIVIGGPMGFSCKYLVTCIQNATSRIAIETPYRSMSIVQGKIKDIGSALGAATLVLQNKAELLYQNAIKVN